MAVLGVDGWRGAWVGALLDGRTVTLLALPDVAAVLAVPDVDAHRASTCRSGSRTTAPRACDVQARRRLGRAGSSVFPAPLRAVLDCADYAEACAVSRAASGKALSVQAWNLVPAIRALDDALGDAAGRPRVEVHPELAFRALDDRVDAPKASARGLAQRIRALRAGRWTSWTPWPPRPPGCRRSTRSTPAPRRGRPGGSPTASASASATARTDSRGRPMRICW